MARSPPPGGGMIRDVVDLSSSPENDASEAPPSATSLVVLPPKISTEEGSITSQLVCSICLSVPHIKPVTTSCGHIYCEPCLAEAATRSQACPYCQQSPYTHEHLRGVLLRCWEAISIECPVEGCGWSGTMGSYKTHLGRCDGAAVKRIRQLESQVKAQEGVKAENEDLRTKIKSLKQKFANTKREKRRSIRKHKDEVKALKSGISVRQQEEQALQASLRESKEEVFRLEMEVQELSSENKKLKRSWNPSNDEESSPNKKRKTSQRTDDDESSSDDDSSSDDSSSSSDESLRSPNLFAVGVLAKRSSLS